MPPPTLSTPKENHEFPSGHNRLHADPHTWVEGTSFGGHGHQLRRDTKPELYPQSDPDSSPTADPALIVAMVLTAVILVVGFATTTVSWRPWRQRSAKPPTARARPISRAIPTRDFATTETGCAEPVSVPTLSPAKRVDGNNHVRRISTVPSFRGYPHQRRISGIGTNAVETDHPAHDSQTEQVPRAGSQDLSQGHDDTTSGYGGQPEVKLPSIGDRWTRPRQGSDASHTTEETQTSAGRLFEPSPSFASSLTSVEDEQDNGATEEEIEQGSLEDLETTFEVKRGQTQSLEIIKGVLLNWPGAVQEAGENQSEASKIPSGRADNCKVTRSKTLPNMRASEDGRNSPRPMVPALIVTQPSTLSLFTMGSSTSNISLDIGQFPLPPLHLEPAVFWQRLEEEINMSLEQKRKSIRLQ